MIKCPIPMFAGKNPQPCLKEGCGVWDVRNGQCSALSYFQAYLAMGLATLKINNAIERIEKEQGDDT